MVLVPQNPTINNVLYSNTIFAGTLPRFQTYPYYHPTPILLPSLIVTSHSTNGNYPQTYIPIIAIVRICRYYSTILGCCHSICIDAQHESSLYPIAYIYILYIHTFPIMFYEYCSQSTISSLSSHMVITHHHPWCFLNHVICPPIYLVCCVDGEIIFNDYVWWLYVNYCWLKSFFHSWLTHYAWWSNLNNWWPDHSSWCLNHGKLRMLNHYWLVVSTPLKNMKVSWDYDIPNIWKVIRFMFQTTNQTL